MVSPEGGSLSFEATKWVLESAPGLPSHLAMTLVGLAWHADCDGRNAYPSQATLARYARKSERAIRKELRELLRLGLIRPGDPSATAHLPADKRPQVYDVVLTASPQSGRNHSSARNHRTGGNGETGGNQGSGAGGTTVPVAGGTTVPPNHPVEPPPEPPSSSSSAAPPKARKVKPAEPVRVDVEQLCQRLADRIEDNGSKRPTITDEWRKQARLLLDADGRELQKALNLIDWCQADSFWRSNVLSMPTFRKQYDRLRLKAVEEHERQQGNGKRAANGGGYQPYRNPTDMSAYLEDL